MVSFERRLFIVSTIVIAICAGVNLHFLAIDPNDLVGNVCGTVSNASTREPLAGRKLRRL